MDEALKYITFPVGRVAWAIALKAMQRFDDGCEQNDKEKMLTGGAATLLAGFGFAAYLAAPIPFMGVFISVFVIDLAFTIVSVIGFYAFKFVQPFLQQAWQYIRTELGMNEDDGDELALMNA